MSITLKAARINLGLTQAQAAEKLGISTNTLQKYEAGITFPNIKMIRKIESVYDVEYNDISFILPKNDN